MIKLLVLLTIAVSLMLVACGAASSSQDEFTLASGEDAIEAGALEAFPVPETVATPAAQPAPANAPKATATRGVAPLPAPPMAPIEEGMMAQSGSADAAVDFQAAGGALPALGLETVERKVISLASISVEVEDVPAAVNQVQATAEGLGGFVEQLSSIGGDEPRASLTVRVPQEQFFTALDRIREVGEVQSENVGSEDVTEQFIDLEARLKSAQRQEESLLKLLERTETMSEILTLERELQRVRSEIESQQGRLNFLERRVDLATISVSLFPPSQKLPEPPGATLTVAALDVAAAVEGIKTLVSSLDGTVDRVFLSGPIGNERATMTFRVFSKDFTPALAGIEGEGEVRDKELREGAPLDQDDAIPEEPDARVDLNLVILPPSEPPSAALTLVVSNVADSVNQVKQLVSSLEGIVDRSNITRREGQDTANLSLRLDRADFLTGLVSMEAEGTVRNKELREGSPSEEGQSGVPQEPDARIDLALVENVSSSNTWLIVAIAAPTGGTTLLVMLGLLFYLAYRSGRTRPENV